MEKKKSNRYGRGYGKKAAHPSDFQTPSEDRCQRQKTPPCRRATRELSREEEVSEEEVVRIFTGEAPDKGHLDHD